MMKERLLGILLIIIMFALMIFIAQYRDGERAWDNSSPPSSPRKTTRLQATGAPIGCYMSHSYFILTR